MTNFYAQAQFNAEYVFGTVNTADKETVRSLALDQLKIYGEGLDSDYLPDHHKSDFRESALTTLDAANGVGVDVLDPQAWF